MSMKHYDTVLHGEIKREILEKLPPLLERNILYKQSFYICLTKVLLAGLEVHEIYP